MHLAGRVAVVTGAASGIGRAVAAGLARRGCHLALVDVDRDGLAEAAGSLALPGLRISRHLVDVSDRAAVAGLPEALASTHGRVDLLVNAAGVALAGRFEQVSADEMEWLFGINFWGVVNVTRALLPSLLASGDARIANISSIYGIVAPPDQATYVASKFAVRGFSESLRHELKGSGVGVTTVFPGGVRTAIARRARRAAAADPAEMERDLAGLQQLLRMDPDRAAAAIVGAIERRRPRLLVGADARAAALLERVLPVGYWRVLRWYMAARGGAGRRGAGRP
jgi:short-subunit dehydrogenase